MPDSTRKTDEELKALIELEAKALPSPWAVFDSATNSLGVGRDEEDEPYVAECIEESSDEPTQANRDNFALIAASRNSIRDIILDLQASRETQMELVASCAEMAEEMRRVEYGTRHYLSIDGPLMPEEWKRRDPHSYDMWERAVDALARAEAKDKP